MNARRAAARIVLVASGLALAVLCVRGIYVRYKADDFWTASIVARLGFWKSQTWWYERWSGRFAYTFLIGVVEAIGPRLVPALVAVTIAGWLSATHVLLRRLGSVHALALSAAFVFAAAEGAPDVPQSILWQTGLLTYVVPLAGLTAWLATTVGRQSLRWYDVVVPFVLAGFSETNTLAQIIALAALALMWPQRRRILAVAVTASVAALIVVAIAPGNGVRMSLYPRHSVLWIAGETLAQVGTFFVAEAVRSGFALLFIFVAAVLLAPRMTKVQTATAFAVAVSVAFVTHFAAATTLALAPPQRTLFVPHVFLVVAVAAAGAAVTLPASLERFALAVLAIVIIAGPLLSAVMRARDIPEAAAFARAWDRLDAQLRDLHGREVDVAGAPGNAGTLLFITHDPDGWANRCVADYYALAGIAAAPRGRTVGTRLLEDLPVYAIDGPRRHDPHNVVRLRFE